jgi:hypothetical protein
MVNLPVAPLQEHLGDEVVRAPIPEPSDITIRKLRFRRTVDVEPLNWNLPPPREPMHISLGQRDAMRAPIRENDGQPGRFGRPLGTWLHVRG